VEFTTLELKGYGSGDGSGYGYGYGSGYSYGDGYADGDGSGYGYGSGDGYGYGSVDGSGYGSGDGYGYSYGSGSGDGDADGDTKTDYIEAVLEQYSKNYRNHTVCFWRCKPDNTPSNGGKGTLAVEGTTETITGPLSICTSKALHGTKDLNKWKGEHYWVVALKNPVQKQEDKFASLERTFVKNLGKCPWN
jgi:hypothetical protein